MLGGRAAIRETLASSLVYDRDPDRELVLLVVVPAGRELTDEQEAAVTGYLRSAVGPGEQVRLSVVPVGGPAPDLDALVVSQHPPNQLLHPQPHRHIPRRRAGCVRCPTL